MLSPYKYLCAQFQVTVTMALLYTKLKCDVTLSRCRIIIPRAIQVPVRASCRKSSAIYYAGDGNREITDATCKYFKYLNRAVSPSNKRLSRLVRERVHRSASIVSILVIIIVYSVM